MKLEEKVEKMLRALPDDIESLEKEKALAIKELKKAVQIPNTLPFTIATIVFGIIIGLYLLLNGSNIVEFLLIYFVLSLSFAILEVGIYSVYCLVKFTREDYYDLKLECIECKKQAIQDLQEKGDVNTDD